MVLIRTLYTLQITQYTITYMQCDQIGVSSVHVEVQTHLTTQLLNPLKPPFITRIPYSYIPNKRYP